MDELALAELCNRYDLGKPTAALEPVTGGLLHRVYRLQTTQGQFAIKVLNPTIMQYANVRENFRRSECIARAVAAANIPAVTALQSVGDIIQDIGQAAVIVFPWMDAQALSSAPARPGQARQIGRILGRIHALPLHFGEPPSSEPQTLPDAEDAEWAFLVAEAEKQQAAWASALRHSLPDIAAWIRSSKEARQTLQGGWVISHGDLDQKNVLWADEQTPWLIDWEAAGYVQPAIEAVGAALNWGGQASGTLEIASFEAFLEGYRQEAALKLEEVRCGLRAYCGDWCGWLKHSMGRSLGLAASDPEERALGTRETFSTLRALHSAAINISALEREL